MLKIEDVNVGDELVCINNNNEYVIVDNIPVSECFLTEKGAIPYENLKYFKKKEQSQYTFDDLIDVAVQAVKDGLIACDDFKRHSISFCVAWDEDDGYELVSHHDAKYFDEAVNFIRSLYKETFVIECEEDIGRIKDNAIVTLSNGHELPAIKARRDEYIEFYGVGDFYFLVLKGATVEQERGRDD